MFSRHGVFRYTLSMYAVTISKSSSAAMRNTILTLYFETNIEYVIDDSTSVICSPATNHILQVKSNFT